ncbi:hypothetical protein P6F28_05410 [Roseicyclus marinus]|uniref:hypothetical protein n=1 Tax=Roseicyclus marinus TaxID=2161673 RepID=UPI00240F62DE|nr:hypothetical protein [Roseicyclus marinus]MDG3040706.1 hypothetical protein [Roseicyclus marinus]
MSDPAKSVSEIEDVLASIRRLVSEGQGAPLVAAPTSAAPRLVLTAAQRVTEPDDPWTPVPSASPATEATSEDPAWGLEDRLSDWGEIESSAEEAIEDAIAEQSAPVPPGPAADASSFEPAAEGDAEEPVFEPETGDTNWPDAGATRALRDLAMVRGQTGGEDVAAGTGMSEDAVADRHTPVTEATGFAEAEAEAEAGGEEKAARPAGEDKTARPAGEAANTGAAQDNPDRRESPMTDETAIGEDPVDEAKSTGAKRTGAKVPLAPRRVVLRPVAVDRAATTNTDAPSGAPVAEERNDAPPAEERTEAPSAEGRHEAQPAEHGDGEPHVEDQDDDPDVEDLGDEPQPFTFPEAEDGILDEETLRQIVAEVVREELQGVLGQRITRNVRKMVRREVRLALAAQDLE